MTVIVITIIHLNSEFFGGLTQQANDYFSQQKMQARENKKIKTKVNRGPNIRGKTAKITSTTTTITALTLVLLLILLLILRYYFYYYYYY